MSPGVIVAFLLTGTAAHAQGHGPKPPKAPKPLVLAEQGSFYVGGAIQFRDPNSTTPGDARFVPGDIAVDQMYVEYQVPHEQKYRYPIIMMHGGGHTGRCTRRRPMDGRAGTPASRGAGFRLT